MNGERTRLSWKGINKFVFVAAAVTMAAVSLSAAGIGPDSLRRTDGGSGISVDLREGSLVAIWNGDKECDAAGVSISAGTEKELPFRRIDYHRGAEALREGCGNGVRMPRDDADDDGDGLINEDRLDGRDNDGDGRVDEDFAAVGDIMLVAEAGGRGKEKVILSRGYAWTYDHVSDFAGFSTIISSNRGVGADTLALRIESVFPGSGCGSGGGIFTSVMEMSEDGDTLRIPLVSDGNIITGVLIVDRKGGAEAEAVLEYKDKAFPRRRETVPGRPEWKEGKGSIYMNIIQPGGGAEGTDAEINWAVVFASNDREFERNVRMALLTYQGVDDGRGGRTHWVVPAKKARVLELESRQVVSWNEGRGASAVAVSLPLEMAGRSVKWIRVNGCRVTDYTISGYNILINPPDGLDRARIEIEGQFSGGSLFRAVTEPGEGAGADSRERDSTMLPESFVKLYPNPFVDNVNITLQITRTEQLMAGRKREVIGGSSSVRIYDVRGELVRTVSETDFLPPGSYNLQWDGTDRRGQKVAPGVYYCTLKIGNRSRTRRVILLK
ncbi:MAG: T9SS type A sorting domain-containing protein [Candidatus Latescibacteria bacterium]|nr:T9SS type A sorting domain-containing protein [bacterium]MBD3425434.1 T9SS type A sorting domain-containing protein [Candidatus Latescibacterota bacterium]